MNIVDAHKRIVVDLFCSQINKLRLQIVKYGPEWTTIWCPIDKQSNQISLQTPAGRPAFIISVTCQLPAKADFINYFKDHLIRFIKIY